MEPDADGSPEGTKPGARSAKGKIKSTLAYDLWVYISIYKIYIYIYIYINIDIYNT